MTGDRRLQPHEMKLFMQHHSIGWDTLKETLFAGGEPSLFEIAFIEIFGKIDAHTELLVETNNFLKSLSSHLSLAITRLNEVDERFEEQKQILMDQINELKKMEEEFLEDV